MPPRGRSKRPGTGNHGLRPGGASHPVSGAHRVLIRGGSLLCCFVLLCCIQQTFFEDRARKLAIRTQRGDSWSPGTVPVALGSGQPAIPPGMDLGGEGQHGRCATICTRGGRCHRCAEGGLPRRDAPRSAAARDGSDQRVGWAGSGKQGASDRARAPPRHGAAGPCCRQRDAASWQLGPTESHSFEMRPSCSARPRGGYQPLRSCGHDSDPTIWISSLPCEYVISMNDGAVVTGDDEWASQERRCLRSDATGHGPSGGSVRRAAASAPAPIPLGYACKTCRPAPVHSSHKSQRDRPTPASTPLDALRQDLGPG